MSENNRQEEHLREQFHRLDKRLTVLEKEFETFIHSHQTIIVKLDALPDKVTSHMAAHVNKEILAHRTACRLEIERERRSDGDNGTKGILPWLLRHQTQIILIILLIAATYLGVKLP